MLNGDLPSERNLWLLRCKPDSQSGSYSSPLILWTCLKNFANRELSNEEDDDGNENGKKKIGLVY